ncbi:MAG: ATP-binding protein [Spirochaetales bacterium]|nr:ATP-binding protein [Spirochaetales bacterium]
MLAKIDYGKLQQAVRSATPIAFRLTAFAKDHHGALDRIIETFLSELGQDRILEPLSYCTKELIANAQKANLKRVFFDERKLRITDATDYERGMAGFHDFLSEDEAKLAESLRENGLHINVSFHASNGVLTIRVRNNAEMTPKEQARIFDRVTRARAFSSFYETLSLSLDSSEGAGLGIPILVQSLARIGLSEEAFSISSGRGETVASLTIPMSQVHFRKISALAEAIARDVDSLPHFPENIVALLAVTSDPEFDINEVARTISTDPALTADLLKLVNSAYFMLPRRVSNILQAIKMIGTRGLRNLLYSYGTQKIMGEKFSEMKELWDHSYRTGFYAFLLARSLKRLHDHLDDVFVAGVLHDLGLIVVTDLHPDLQEKIQRFCAEKDIPSRLLENFSYGLNHADLGGMIASKWNFPEQLVEGIRYHHDPLAASVAHKDIVSCVYLADAICDVERGLLSYDQIEPPVLHEFGIDTEEQLKKLQERLERMFNRQQMKLRVY